MVLVSGSTIQSTEYAAEQNNHPSCGNGYKGNGTTSWPCTADGPCTGKTYNGHGRGACQWGTARWATGDVLSSCSLAGSHGYGTKTWQQILSHYYPNWTLASCGSVAPPSNNNCSGAQTLTVYPTSACGGATTGTISGATQSIAPLACAGYTSTLCTDVWYKFTATTTAHTITVVPSSGMDAVVDLRSGACNGSNIACADNGGGHGATEVINATGLTAGTTYYVRVYDYTGSSVPPTSYTFTICVTTPTPPQCAVTSFSPASIAHDPTAFSTNITVSANANCAYTVTGVCSWLSVTPASGYANISGQFTLSCVVQANTSATARTCTFYVNSTPFTVTQSGCAYNLSLASNSVSASGSTYNLSISTSSPCAWTVANPCSSWVNISQSSGTGTGNISLTVSPNTSCSTRSCTLTVTPGNATHTITQLANTPPTVSVSPANPFFCEGNVPVTITASGATLYNWTPSTGLSSPTMSNPTANLGNTTTYTVTGTTGSCTATASITVTVNPLPAMPSATSTYSCCQDSTPPLLTATGTNLLWYTVPSGGTGFSTAPIPSTTIPGIYYYYVSQTENSCESPRTEITVTVNSAPAAPVATTSLTYCLGDIAAPLTATGTNLLWYTVPSGGTGFSTAPIPSTTIPGIYYYYVSQTENSCESPRTEITVTVNSAPAAPVATTSLTYCLGDIAAPLTATGTNLLWYSSPADSNGTPTPPTPPTTSAGTILYYVSQTLNGCESPRTEITVNILDVPSTPTITISYPDLISNAPDGNQWYGPTGIITGADSSVFSPNSEGNYYVVVTLNGCSSDSSNIVEFWFFGIDSQPEESAVKIYPNPVTNELIIEMEGNNKPLDFVIYNAIGAEVYKGVLLHQVRIQTKHFAPGVYQIKFDDKNTVEFRKIIKE